MSDRLVIRCVRCGAPKPNDLSWARPCMECPKCGHTVFGSTVTFQETHDGVIVHGDVDYELLVPEDDA